MPVPETCRLDSPRSEAPSRCDRFRARRCWRRLRTRRRAAPTDEPRRPQRPPGRRRRHIGADRRAGSRRARARRRIPDPSTSRGRHFAASGTTAPASTRQAATCATTNAWRSHSRPVTRSSPPWMNEPRFVCDRRSAGAAPHRSPVIASSSRAYRDGRTRGLERKIHGASTGNRQGSQQAREERRQQRARAAAQHCQTETLDQQQPHDARSAGTERDTEADLLLAASRPGHQQAGDVRAGDEEGRRRRASGGPSGSGYCSGDPASSPPRTGRTRAGPAMPSFSTGNAVSSWPPRRVTAACACSRDIPGRSRPTTASALPFRRSSSVGSTDWLTGR